MFKKIFVLILVFVVVAGVFNFVNNTVLIDDFYDIDEGVVDYFLNEFCSLDILSLSVGKPAYIINGKVFFRNNLSLEEKYKYINKIFVFTWKCEG